ncbi:hypothetical protein B0J13DRAFT_206283 [Dactylonectria estremocensis]|uniref:Uncharacterized protein n=1 Tax=Dactylonectria estremocensis TaxID=1079267 RepID=A0A9P9IDC7_9HYPO|nr:hypothetical protein B0J13DRAFT_206283 [Dactylonectria estremocensis]
MGSVQTLIEHVSLASASTLFTIAYMLLLLSARFHEHIRVKRLGGYPPCIKTGVPFGVCVSLYMSLRLPSSYRESRCSMVSVVKNTILPRARLPRCKHQSHLHSAELHVLARYFFSERHSLDHRGPRSQRARHLHGGSEEHQDGPGHSVPRL